MREGEVKERRGNEVGKIGKGSCQARRGKEGKKGKQRLGR